jgi:hypothetical protein
MCWFQLHSIHCNDRMSKKARWNKNGLDENDVTATTTSYGSRDCVSEFTASKMERSITYRYWGDTIELKTRFYLGCVTNCWRKITRTRSLHLSTTEVPPSLSLHQAIWLPEGLCGKTTTFNGVEFKTNGAFKKLPSWHVHHDLSISFTYLEHTQAVRFASIRSEPRPASH